MKAYDSFIFKLSNLNVLIIGLELNTFDVVPTCSSSPCKVESLILKKMPNLHNIVLSTIYKELVNLSFRN